jgi:hypothetical protein
MQNTPERLLAGTALSLRTTVAPAVTDSYALAQIQAAAEILDNLAARVAWRADVLEAPMAEVASLLTAATERAPASELPRGRAWLARPLGPPDARDWTAALDALAELQEWLAADPVREPELASRVRLFVSADVKREIELLRTGMYRSASRDSSAASP